MKKAAWAKGANLGAVTEVTAKVSCSDEDLVNSRAPDKLLRIRGKSWNQSGNINKRSFYFKHV